MRKRGLKKGWLILSVCLMLLFAFQGRASGGGADTGFTEVTEGRISAMEKGSGEKITKTKALDSAMLKLIRNQKARKKVQSVVYTFQGNGTDREAVVTDSKKISQVIRAIGALQVLTDQGEAWTDYDISYRFLDAKGKMIASVSFDGPSIVKFTGGSWHAFQCVEGKTKMPEFEEVSRDGEKSPKGTVFTPGLPVP